MGNTIKDKVTETQSMKKTENKTNNKINETTSNATEKKSWKDILYNCPYFLLLVASTVVAMLCSDEIGINLMNRGQSVTAGANITNASTNGSDVLEAAVSDSDITEDKAGDGGKTPDKESAVEDGVGQKPKSTFAQTEKKEETQKRGITRFEYYEPQHIDSIYYSDAGKVAMTTEYDYAIENTSYFNDAAFLGDSRTLGIADYAGIDEADFFCDSGMTIFKLLEEDGVTYQKTGHKVDLKQVLQEKQYGKIYIMLGMNELGYGNTEMYLKQYREVVEQIREWQPDAIIYIMANLHVSEAKNNPETEFNNININDKNAASALLANGKDIFYLDCNPLFTDKNGFLNADLTFDGVHLYAQNYDAWRKFLLEHGVERIKTEEGIGRTDNDRDAVE